MLTADVSSVDFLRRLFGGGFGIVEEVGSLGVMGAGAALFFGVKSDRLRLLGTFWSGLRDFIGYGGCAAASNRAASSELSGS